jgi:hypothetical protein
VEAADERDTVRAVTARGLPSTLEAGPNLNGLLPALIVVGLPHDAALAADRLRVPLGRFESVRGDVLEAELEVPPGRWRVWPQRGAALWIGQRPDSFPAEPSEGRGLDLVQTLLVLADAGLWPSELRVLKDTGWTPVLGVAAAARALTRVDDVVALFGVWSDVEGAAALRACLFSDGVVRAETEGLAERLLILLGSLSDE